MSFIKIMGHNRPKTKMLLNTRKKKEALPEQLTTKEPTITTKIEDEQLHLQLVGDNVKEDSKYEWLITIDDKTITTSSTGPKLTLSKSNTLKYVKADKTNVIVSSENYTSPTFTI